VVAAETEIETETEIEIEIETETGIVIRHALSTIIAALQ
jgi:ABC-type transport system involved in Fe-S cluster assembly fused permease/ATPase subunit